MKRFILFLLLIAMIPVGLVAAQGSSTNFTNQRSVILSSNTVASTNFRVRGTVGQTASDELSSGNYIVSNGFYFGNGKRVPTAVGLGQQLTRSTLTPFWLLIVFALTLFSLSIWLRRRAR